MARMESPERRRFPHEHIARFATSLVVGVEFISDYDWAIHLRLGEELKIETDVYTSVGPFLVFHHKATRPDSDGVVMEVIVDMVVLKRDEAGNFNVSPLPQDIVEIVRNGSHSRASI